MVSCKTRIVKFLDAARFDDPSIQLGDFIEEQIESDH